jgi:hypothetical protein
MLADKLTNREVHFMHFMGGKKELIKTESSGKNL